MKKILYMILGYAGVGMGVLGVVIPVLLPSRFCCWLYIALPDLQKNWNDGSEGRSFTKTILRILLPVRE